MGFSGATYGAALGEIAKVASGYDHVTKTGDNTFDIYFKDGSKVSVTIPGITTAELDAKIQAAFDSHKSEFVTADYPQYTKDEMNMVADKLMGFVSTINNPIIIGFNTDQHLIAKPTTSTQTKTTNEIVYGLRALRDLTKKIPFNAVVLGGDTIGTGDTTSAMQEDTAFVIEQMNGANCPFVCLVGNHEGGQNDTSITLEKVFKSHITESIKDKSVTLMDKAMNGYYDDVTSDTRIIFLNSFVRSGIYARTEIEARLRSALETMPDGYKAVIFSHHPIDTNLPQNSERTLWNNPIALQSVLIEHKDKIICCVCGHTHNNLSEMCDGIRFITTPCAGRYELNDGSTRPYDSADATVFDVLVIDKENHKIHCVRYGNGSDRELTYEDVPPTPSGRENILADVTWTDGVRFNSTGAFTDAAGYSSSSMVDVKSGDTLYFADGVMPTDTKSFTGYDDDGNAFTVNPITSSEYGANYVGSNMYISLRKSDDTNAISYNLKGVMVAKSDTTSKNGQMFGEIQFYESGYIKSCVVDYKLQWSANVAGVRFTFPTAKKGNLLININKPIE